VPSQTFGQPDPQSAGSILWMFCGRLVSNIQSRSGQRVIKSQSSARHSGATRLSNTSESSEQNTRRLSPASAPYSDRCAGFSRCWALIARAARAVPSRLYESGRRSNAQHSNCRIPDQPSSTRTRAQRCGVPTRLMSVRPSLLSSSRSPRLRWCYGARADQ